MPSLQMLLKYILRGKPARMKTKTGASGSAMTGDVYFALQAYSVFKVFHYLACVTCTFFKNGFWVSTERVPVWFETCLIDRSSALLAVIFTDRGGCRRPRMCHWLSPLPFTSTCPSCVPHRRLMRALSSLILPAGPSAVGSDSTSERVP